MTGVAAVEAAWWFAAFLLVGAAITVTLALSSGRADALALATPLGPQTVALARLAAVLGVDALVGLASSAAFAWWGSIELGFVVVSWLVPLALVAGASAFVAVWSETPWAGAVVGAVLVPLVLPAAQADTAGGAWGLVGVVQGALCLLYTSCGRGRHVVAQRAAATWPRRRSPNAARTARRAIAHLALRPPFAYTDAHD